MRKQTEGDETWLAKAMQWGPESELNPRCLAQPSGLGRLDKTSVPIQSPVHFKNKTPGKQTDGKISIRLEPQDNFQTIGVLQDTHFGPEEPSTNFSEGES